MKREHFGLGLESIYGIYIAENISYEHYFAHYITKIIF